VKSSLRNPSFDVLVIGGGPAGVVAAIQSSRGGARTLLVEKIARLGGTTVNAGINRPGLFHAWGRQIIRGIGWELVTRTAGAMAALAASRNCDPEELPMEDGWDLLEANDAIVPERAPFSSLSVV